MTSFTSANLMGQMASALASPSEENIAKAFSLFSEVLTENASLKTRLGLVEQHLKAAKEEHIHNGIKVSALESVIMEREASIKHLVGLHETANSNLSKATAELDENRDKMIKIQSLTESDQEQRADILTTISSLEQENVGLKHSLDIRTDQRDALDSVCDDLRSQIAMLTANQRLNPPEEYYYPQESESESDSDEEDTSYSIVGTEIDERGCVTRP